MNHLAQDYRPRAGIGDRRYLLVAAVPFFRAADGGIWLDSLWWRDLSAHLDYIENLTVLAPCESYEGQPDLVRFAAPEERRLDFAALPSPVSFGRALASLPRSAAIAFRAVRRSDIVHSGVAGWPIPPGLLVNPIAAILRRPLIVVVESAF